MNPLQLRLAALRRRLRWVVTFRGCCWLASLFGVTLLAAGWLDWHWHLPSPVRAILSLAALGGGGVVGYRYLLHPLRARVDDLTLALRVEQYYPDLNDCLASTVQFLEQPERASHVSPSLRRVAVNSAMRRSDDCDFFRVVDTRGLRSSVAMMAGSGAVALVLVLLYPSIVATALARLANPFGSRDWPPQTQLVLENYRPRVARGEPYEIRCLVSGVIPDRAVIDCEGALPTRQICTSAPDGDASGERLTGRWNQVERSFRFRIRANDADTGWQPVEVLTPPQLALLNGRPSPQVRLDYPSYTDLPAQELPDGTSTIEGVAGTLLTLKAATEQPILRAWIEQPIQPIAPVLAALGPLQGPTAGHSTVAALAHLAVTGAPSSSWEPIPAHVGPEGRILSVQFVPRVSGTYALYVEDSEGLASARRFEVRVLIDPAPTVHLERPSSSHDSLALLPTADIPLKVDADDFLFAVRSVWLEIRCRNKYGEEKRLPLARRELFDPRELGHSLRSLGAALAAAPLPVPVPDLRLRPPRVRAVRTWSLAELGLEEGDLLTVQACADDFDDVVALKQPGRSQEVELRIIGLPALETLLNQEQATVQQELLRLHKRQEEALRKVVEAEGQWRRNGKLRPEDVDQLLQTEALQRQIREHVGNREEGLRADIDRILQTLRANHVPRSGAQERMEMVGRELARLAREELDQVAPRLAQARKEAEDPAKPRQPTLGDKGHLGEAREHQEEIELALQELLKRLEPWSSTRELRGEAKAILQEQRLLQEKTKNLSQEVPSGARPADLDSEQKAALSRAQDAQAKLAERIGDLLNKIDRMATTKEGAVQEKKLTAQKMLRLAQDQSAQKDDQARALEEAARAVETSRQSTGRQARDKLEQAQQKLRQARERPLANAEAATALADAANAMEDAAALTDLAEPIQAAARQGRENDPSSQMKTARDKIAANQLGAAGSAQQASLQGLQKVVKALEERREEELDRLVKKLHEAESRLEELVRDQDELRKKIQQAAQLTDPKQREQELKRLAREQEQLRQRTHELVQHLTRLRAENAAQSLSQADEQMAQAVQRLERGETPEDREEDTLDRLEDARQELRQTKKEDEDELMREQLAKIADQIKQIRERQEGLNAESARIQKAAQERHEWTRSLLVSLGGMANAQRVLGQETAVLQEKLINADVFARLLGKSAKAMERAAEGAEGMLRYRGRIPEDPKFTTADEATRQGQEEAKRRLDQLLEALKPVVGAAGAPASADGDQPGGAAGQPGGGDDIPQVAQLKLLRALQQEINERTTAFGKAHPDLKKLTQPQQKDLSELAQEQQEIVEMLEKLTSTAATEGEKP